MDATIRQLSDRVWVGGQVDPADAEALAKAGFTWIVSHRPDDEDVDQPSAAQMAVAVQAAGMGFVHAPVRGLPDPAAVGSTREVLDALGEQDKAVFFCRSGMRSSVAWAMAERLKGMDADDLRAAAGAAGYDLSRVPL